MFLPPFSFRFLQPWRVVTFGCSRHLTVWDVSLVTDTSGFFGVIYQHYYSTTFYCTNLLYNILYMFQQIYSTTFYIQLLRTKSCWLTLLRFLCFVVRFCFFVPYSYCVRFEDVNFRVKGVGWWHSFQDVGGPSCKKAESGMTWRMSASPRALWWTSSHDWRLLRTQDLEPVTERHFRFALQQEVQGLRMTGVPGFRKSSLSQPLIFSIPFQREEKQIPRLANRFGKMAFWPQLVLNMIRS